MPTFRNLSVQVTDENEMPLKEWGVKSHDRSGLSTCYIQSKADMKFHVQITPQIPFPARQAPTSSDPETDSEEELDTIAMLCRDSQKRTKAHAPWYNFNEGKSRSSHKAAPIPWHLLATFRLDGRKEHEKKVYVYLARDQPGFLVSRGMVIMRSRRGLDSDGEMVEGGWSFKDVGIDCVFEKLAISSTAEDIPARDEDELLAALQGLGTTEMEDQEEKSTFGQIEITLERVTIGQTRIGGWQPKPEKKEDVSVKARDLTKFTHTAARDKGVRTFESINAVEYDLLDPKDRLYATFKFYYRHEDVLRKFEFPGFPLKAAKHVNSKKQRKDALSKVAEAPLSIVQPNPPRYILNDEGVVIAEEYIPDIGAANKARANTDATDDDKEWIPKYNQFPTIAIGSPTSLPDSPPDSPVGSDDSTSTALLTSHRTGGNAKMIGPSLDAEQSSADESSPLKDMKVKAPYDMMRKFRMVDNEVGGDDEADDEASEGADTATELSEDEEDKGVSQDRPDEGISKGLGEIVLGSKRVMDEDEEEDDGVSKKFKEADEEEEL